MKKETPNILNRDFKGVWIRSEIWLDLNLTWMEKLLLTEIDSLDNEDGCYASNNYFAEFFQLSAGRISQIIKSLKEKKYVSCEYFYKKDSKEIEKRVLRILNINIKNTKGGIKNIKEGYLENAKDNNTSINNTMNKEEGQKENLKNSFKEPEKEKKIPDISPDDDFILKLKNTPEFKKALNNFCIIKTDFEKIGNQVIKLALKHRATIEEIVDSLRICHKQNKSGIIPYFGGVLKRKILNRAGGDNEPASAQQKDMPKPKKPHIINAIQKTQITDFIHDGLLKYNKVITYSIDWNNLNIKILFIDKNNRTQLRTIDEVVTKCRNLFGIFVNTKVLN